jgi:hypothetical protein
LTKAFIWKYEKEWRIILPENGKTSKVFDPDALVSVHLGCLITKKHKNDILNWCSQRKVKPRIFMTSKDESSYVLKETEISY